MSFRIADIRHNPFRNVSRYPLQEEKVKALRESLHSTGYWGNLVARLKDGKPELAFGHHRLEALRQVYGDDEEIDLIIRDYNDEKMLRVTARENQEVWGPSASFLLETVSAFVEAYASNKITLREPEPTTRASVIRYAPSFAPGGHDGRPAGHHPYTAQSLGESIGWLKPSGKPQDKIHHVLGALQLIEEGTLTESDFEGLTPMQIQPVVERARGELKQGEDAAKTHEEQAEQARRETETANTPEERERATRREKTHRQKAKAVRKKGRYAASAVARDICTKLKSGEDRVQAGSQHGRNVRSCRAVPAPGSGLRQLHQ